MAVAVEVPVKFSVQDGVITCSPDGKDKVPLHAGKDAPATHDVNVSEACDVLEDDGGDWVKVRLTADIWEKLEGWTKRMHLRAPSSAGEPAVIAEPAVPLVRRAASPLENFVGPVTLSLRHLQPGNRPGCHEKLVRWLTRSGLCSSRENSAVPLYHVVQAMVGETPAGPLKEALLTLAAAEPPDDEKPPTVEKVAGVASRCLKRLKHQPSFLKWPLDLRSKWFASQTYATSTVEPARLVEELERLGMIKVAASPDVALGHRQVTYDEDMLSSTVDRTQQRISEAAAKMCRVLRVDGTCSGKKSCMGQVEQSEFKAWLKVHGCQLQSGVNGPEVTIRAGSARLSTTLAIAQDLEQTLVMELPLVLKCLCGAPQPVLPGEVVNSKMRGFVLGKKGEDIKKLEAKHNVRLTHRGDRFTGWVSTALLPKDGTVEDLRGLGRRLSKVAEAATVAIQNRIHTIIKVAEQGNKEFLQRRAQRQEANEWQRKTEEKSPLQDMGQFGAAQEDRDQARARDCRKREQRKVALMAKAARQNTWKKMRDSNSGNAGGRHKAGEYAVAPEDAQDAPDGADAPSGEPLIEGFKSQLDAPSQKVPGSRPRHRGHKPQSQRVPFDPAAPAPKRKIVQRGYSDIYKGMDADSSTEEDDLS